MLFSATAIITLLSPMIAAAPTTYYSIDSTDQFPRKCTTGVHMISLRGTSTDPHDQFVGGNGPIAGQGGPMDITNIITGFTGATPRVPGSNAVGLVYPASFDYQNSMNQGATALVKAVADYLAENRCPESKISILGYSQGAQVLSEVLCTGKLDKYRHAISSAVAFTNPAQEYHESYSEGTSRAPKGRLTPQVDCSAYADIYRSWCDADDYYCANGNSMPVHQGYFNNPTSPDIAAAADWVAKRAGVRD